MPAVLFPIVSATQQHGTIPKIWPQNRADWHLECQCAPGYSRVLQNTTACSRVFIIHNVILEKMFHVRNVFKGREAYEL